MLEMNISLGTIESVKNLLGKLPVLTRILKLFAENTLLTQNPFSESSVLICQSLCCSTLMPRATNLRKSKKPSKNLRREDHSDGRQI